MSGYRTSNWYQSSDNWTILSGFQMFRRFQPDYQYQNRFQTGSKLVLNRFGTSFGTRFVSDVGLETIGTGSAKYRRLELEWTGRPITGQYCPDFESYLKSGGIYNRTTLEIAENRTSGFRRFTVYRKRSIYIDNIPIIDRFYIQIAIVDSKNVVGIRIDDRIRTVVLI